MKSYFFYTDQLTVGYDGKPLIKEINIQLNKGEILTLIGPNGAGKSTILKSITRQLSLISGTVYLEQEQMIRMTNKEVSRKLAVVLTERMRPELMTCEDVVSTGRYPYTGTLGILSPEDKEKVKNAMLEFELKHHRKPCVAMMGLAFKPNIDDLRESPAKYITTKVMQSCNNANILVVEPNVKEHHVFKLTDYKEAYDKADIVVFLTAHTPFKELEWREDKVILDFCGIFKK